MSDALARVPRSRFSASNALPPEPVIFSMLTALKLVGTERVLEIGSPTGYAAALLSLLAGEVYSLTTDSELAQRRQRELHALDCENVRVVHADAHAGWPTAAPYQAILVAAGVTDIPIELIDQLDLGGRLVVPVGEAGAQLLELLCKHRGALDSETLGACHLSMLPGAERSPASFPWTHESET